jgi:hypothetical protein
MRAVADRVSMTLAAVGRAASAAAAGVGRRTATLWRRLQAGRRQGVPVVMLVADRRTREALERSLAGGLRRLRLAVDLPASVAVTVVVQHVLLTEGAGGRLAGCSELAQQADGGRAVLIRLALQPEGRRLTADELLAVLAEQWLALAAQLDGGTRVLVPLVVAALAEPLPTTDAPTTNAAAVQAPARDGTRSPGGSGANGHARPAVKP